MRWPLKPRLEQVVVAGALMRMRLALTYARWPLMKGLLTVFRGFAASASSVMAGFFASPGGSHSPPPRFCGARCSYPRM